MDEERVGSQPMDEPEPFLLSRRAFLGMGVAATAALALESTAAAAGPGGRATNRRPNRQPASPPARPSKLTPTQRASIVKVRIHPGFGMMRVGNSTDAFYLGPEVPGAIPKGKTAYRDDSGAVARQGVRFRIYGYDADGNVVGEITKADAKLKWAAHLANTKAAWYRFDGSMDIPEGQDETRRNPDVTGTDRQNLVLDAGKQVAVPGSSVPLHATAMGVTKLLGELLIDAKGHLIVLPGLGKAESWEDGSHVYTYANNNTWLDDMADGPVTATVRMDGRKLKADGAWVAAGPPNYAPGVATGWRTLHDVLEDVWVTGGLSTAAETVSFRRHILPMFTHLARLQWVNAGILRDHGWKSAEDLSDPILLAQLADKSAGNKPFRKSWQKRFRKWDLLTQQPDKLPPILGDAANFPVNSPRQWIAPTKLQWQRLAKWAAGDFDSDGITEPPVAAKIQNVPLGEQPGSLDRAALDGCLGDAFLPGCELTWPIRHASLWRAPYRIKVRKNPEPDWGDTLTVAKALADDGPLGGQTPGSLTRWMALPWQTDTVDCLSGYQPDVDPYLDTFWPARAPNQVLTAADYAIVMDTDRPTNERKQAFKRREAWLRAVLVPKYHMSLNNMVKKWEKLGFVVAKPGPSDGPFPAFFAVEEDRVLPEPSTAEVPAPSLEGAVGR